MLHVKVLVALDNKRHHHPHVLPWMRIASMSRDVDGQKDDLSVLVSILSKANIVSEATGEPPVTRPTFAQILKSNRQA